MWSDSGVERIGLLAAEECMPVAGLREKDPVDFILATIVSSIGMASFISRAFFVSAGSSAG